MLKRIISLLVIAVMAMAVLLAGCAGEPDTKDVADGTKKVLRVGTTADFPPFEFKAGSKNEEYAGFDIDLIRAIGDELGYEVEIQNLPFEGLNTALNAGNIDVIIASVSITPQRQERVLFSEPYYHSGLSIVVAQDNEDIKSIDDLVGKRVSVQIGTTAAQRVTEMDGVQVNEFSSFADTFADFKNGGVDAVVNDRPVNDYYISSTNDTRVKVINEWSETEDYAIAMDKKQTELCIKINEAMKKLRENGKYQEIHDKWFAVKK